MIVSWELFWTAVFFASLAIFVTISLLISWRGFRDLRELFARLRGIQGRSDQAGS